MTNKITKKEFFGMLKEVVEGCEPANMAELVAFIDHEVELIDKKSANRKTTNNKKIRENAEITELVIEELTKIGKTTITDLLKKSEVLSNYVTADDKPLSNQKITSILKPLCLGDNPSVERIVEKKNVYFKVIE